MSGLTNRVAQSGLRTIDLETLAPTVPTAQFDLRDYLYQGLVLREKEFREALTQHDWSQYAGKVLLVFCSADAIIPPWAPMLVSAHAHHFAADIFYGNTLAYLESHYRNAIQQMDISDLEDARVVVKGCSSRTVPPGAYPELVKRLQPVVQSLMFGEPCSTVPVYKRVRS